MSGQEHSDLKEETAALAPAGSAAEPQIAGPQKPQESSEEDQAMANDKKEYRREDDPEGVGPTFPELTTLPWPGDKDKQPQRQEDEDIWSEPEERDTGISQDMSEEQSQPESDTKSKSKWRESMPEGERWRDDDDHVQRDRKGDGSLADDEEEDEEEEDDDGGSHWMSEKATMGFTPQVTIMRLVSEEPAEESRLFIDKDTDGEAHGGNPAAVQFYPGWAEPDDKYYLCDHLCGDRVKLALTTALGALLFPFLLWGGYALLPFESPRLESAPLRVVYTLRCSFFATIPILFGMLVQGVARLRFSAMKPLYQSAPVNKGVAVHGHYVSESVGLFLFFFLQLAVMATYISQDLVKLVPLLTIIFAFGRLIYWLCLSLGSSVRGLGFSFSFFPILVMLGVNLYFVCSSLGEDSVFDVEPPTTAPPPRQRWWG